MFAQPLAVLDCTTDLIEKMPRRSLDHQATASIQLSSHQDNIILSHGIVQVAELQATSEAMMPHH
jgi:hypothetical protein